MDTIVLSSYLDQTSFQTREDRLESDLYSKQQVSRITFFETLLMYRVFFLLFCPKYECASPFRTTQNIPDNCRRRG